MATFAIDVAPAEALRLAKAFGSYLNLTDGAGAVRDATAQEIKAYLVNVLRGVVRQQERLAAERQISIATFDAT